MPVSFESLVPMIQSSIQAVSGIAQAAMRKKPVAHRASVPAKTKTPVPSPIKPVLAPAARPWWFWPATVFGGGLILVAGIWWVVRRRAPLALPGPSPNLPEDR